VSLDFVVEISIRSTISEQSAKGSQRIKFGRAAGGQIRRKKRYANQQQ
jgi:hypothetical protein